MDVLVLAWDAVDGGGAGLRATGLASALARHGAVVRLVTRLAEEEDATVLRRVEVHAVPDVAPVLPDELGSRVLRARGFATAALAVATRRLVERRVDLTVAVGADAHEVVTRLPAAAGTIVLDPGVRGRPDWDSLVAAATRVRADGRPVVLSAPTAGVGAGARTAAGPAVVVVPAAGPAPRARPGPPPPTGPVHLVVERGASHDRAARRLRATLDAARTRRVITSTTRYRPAVVVVLDPDAGDAVLLGAARGVPVVARHGPAGELVTALRCGVVVPDEAAAADACVGLLRDAAAAARLGGEALAASERARRDAVGALARLLGPDGPDARGHGVADDATSGGDGEAGGPPLLHSVD